MTLLPKSWADVTIRQYQLITQIVASTNPELEKRIELTELFIGVETTNKLTLKQLSDIDRGLSFLNAPPSEALTLKFTIGDRSFTVEPFTQRLTAGQYIDLTHLLSVPADTINNLHNIMAVLSTEKAGYEGYEANGAVFLDSLTMDVVYPISVFFLKLGQKLPGVIDGFLKAEMKQAMKESKAALTGSRKRVTTSIGAGT